MCFLLFPVSWFYNHEPRERRLVAAAVFKGVNKQLLSANRRLWQRAWETFAGICCRALTTKTY